MELTIKKLEFAYHCFPVLKGVDFSLNKGELVCVLGKNGAGKSTLFRCILGLLKGYQGEILIDGMERRHFSEKKLAKKVAYIPQNHDTTFSFSVLDMVMMGTTASLHQFAGPGKREKVKAESALRLLDILHLKERSYGHISGGEQQLVLIARAIAQDAKILIMDEPCSSLDYGNQIRVMSTLRTLAERGYLIVQSTHNPEHVFCFAHKVMVMMDGKIKSFGNPEEVMTKELLEDLYDVSIDIYEDKKSGKKMCMPGKGERVCGNYMTV